MRKMEQAAKNTPGLVLVTDMPDIASRELRNPEETLDWVGMSEVHQPLRIRDGGKVREVQARVQIYVDLADPQAKGIHMSRLYLILDEHSETRPLSVAGLKLLLASLLESHRGLSSRAFVQCPSRAHISMAKPIWSWRLACTIPAPVHVPPRSRGNSFNNSLIKTSAAPEK